MSDWILFTTVRVLTGSVQNRDAILFAVTQLGPFKLEDTMVVTECQPNKKIVIEHSNRSILGKGIFTIREISDDNCEFTWQEITPVPYGLFGRACLVLLKPIMKIFYDISLYKLKRNVEADNY